MATIVEKFAAVGIYNRSKSDTGESQRTTGRGQTSLAAYATSRFRVLPSGAVSYSIPLNSFTQNTDPETGEVERVEHVEWVQVVFPHAVSLGAGDHLLAIGQWVPGKQRGIAEDGTAVFWNDTFYAREWAITPKQEKPAATATVTQVADIEDEQEALLEAFDAAKPAVPGTRTPRRGPRASRTAKVTDLIDVP